LNIDRHHLVPKCRGGKDQFYVHKMCHRKIHATFTEKELEKKFHTWDELKNHPDMATFITWIQKKDPGWYDGSVSTNEKRRK
jgi:hypothetical protein